MFDVPFMIFFLAGCGGILNMTSGTFASPGYPFSYTNNLNCLWTLPIPTDGVLSLQFERFTSERWYVHEGNMSIIVPEEQLKVC